jgi:predicted outer membrane repeat protein
MFRSPARLFYLGVAVCLAWVGFYGVVVSLGRVERVGARPSTTITVTNTNDSGPGSLRQAILDANGTPGADVIQVTAVGTIALLSPLPVISEETTIQGPGANHLAVDGGNSFRVLESTAVTLTIADLTVQHGHPTSGEGGGIRSMGPLTLTNVAVLSNTSPIQGGGVYADGKPYIVNGRFQNNQSLGSIGGGLMSPSRVFISGTTFISNSSPGQGGGALVHTYSTIVNAWFENNRSLLANGGGLYASGVVTLTNSTFISNTAFGDGGAVLAFGQASVYGSHFINNQSSDQGGAMYVGSFLVIKQSTFIDNRGGRGGALFHGGYPTRFENSLFARNTATLAGAHLFLNGPASIDIVNVTMVGTGSGGGTGIHVVNSSVALTNTIIASHTIGIDNLNGSVSQDYNLFYGNGVDTQGVVTGGVHNISGSPGFIDLAQNNYHLGAGSAAIDAGTDTAVTEDYDGEIRPLDGGVDIGFDESNYIEGLAIAFTPNPTTTVGIPTTFTATVTRGTGISYEWSFGDGTAVVAGNPVVRVFSAPGVYPVTVTATNSSGSVTTATTVEVMPLPNMLFLPFVRR